MTKIMNVCDCIKVSGLRQPYWQDSEEKQK